MLPMERHVALVYINNVAGVIYLDNDGYLNTINIVTTLTVPEDGKARVIGQQGNKLTNGPEVVKINALELCCSVLVPMQEAFATILGLKWDSALDLTTENYTLWSRGDIANNFPSNGAL